MSRYVITEKQLRNLLESMDGSWYVYLDGDNNIPSYSGNREVDATGGVESDDLGNVVDFGKNITTDKYEDEMAHQDSWWRAFGGGMPYSKHLTEESESLEDASDIPQSKVLRTKIDNVLRIINNKNKNIRDAAIQYFLQGVNKTSFTNKEKTEFRKRIVGR